MKRLTVCIAAALLLASLAGCSGLPEDLRKEVEEGLKVRFETVTTEIQTETTKFVNLKQSPASKAAWAFLAPYAEKERWEDHFGTAQRTLEAAKKEYQEALDLLNNNRTEDEQTLRTKVRSITDELRTAADEARHASERSSFLSEARDHAVAKETQAKAEATKVRVMYESLVGAITKAKRDFTNKKTDLEQRRQAAEKVCLECEKARDTALASLHQRLPDYALFGDSCTTVSAKLAQFTDGDRDLRKRLGQLGRSYAKILVDMRVEYYVQVVRVSWDENSDWETEHEHVYQPVKVDREVYEYFRTNYDERQDDGNDSDWIADTTDGGSSTNTIQCDQVKWNALNINPGESWESGWLGGDNYANFYVHDMPVKCFHKYTIVENGKRHEVEEEVSEEFFDEYDDDLGMEIVSKPYGLYEDEKITEPAPPGMAEVGDFHYGHWQGTGNGRYWTWYDRWNFYCDLVQPRYHYTYVEWDTWSDDYRGERGYYGPANAKVDRYGTRSQYALSNPRYASSYWVRSGEHRFQMSSIRSAGGSFRAGGPGGGGK
ncbi:MAG: hypothetical protein WCT32_04790 [Patescibacteria group bacterium]|jgi:hypothetical protein